MVTFQNTPSLARYFCIDKMIALGMIDTNPLEHPLQEPQEEPTQTSLAEKMEALKSKLPVIRQLPTKSPQQQLFQ